MKYISPLLLLILLTFSCQSTENPGVETNIDGNKYERIVSLSGSITETLFALGYGDKIVAVDVTSTYPADALVEVPRLGHIRQLNVEGVLAQRPDLILILEGNASLPAVQQLKESGIELLILSSENTFEAPIKMALAIEEKLGAEGRSKQIEQKLSAQKTQLEALLKDHIIQPKVLFIYARGAGNMMVAGRDTPAEAMINLAGGQNAITEFEGFKTLSTEGLIQAQPDYLLLFESGLEKLGGKEQLFQIEGIQQTPAGKNQRVITMDGLRLLGFTPRMGSAALDLATQLLQE